MPQTHRPRFTHLLVALVALAPLLAVAAPAVATAASVLPSPTLRTGENIRHEVGLVNGLLVDRYTWRDSKSRPRSVSLVRYGQKVDGRPHGGYADQLTYQVQNATTHAWSTVRINPPADDQGDGGFGYFVSHENYRTFDANVCADGTNQCPIASLHGEDDSPLGLSLPGSGSLTAISSSSAIHTFKLNYPHWGTAEPIDDIQNTPTPSDPEQHRRYNLPASIRWQVTSGKDYPLITITYDLRAIPPNVVSVDVRGPYGWMQFDPANAPLSRVQWADQYVFSTTGSSVSTKSGWTWNKVNTGARYNLLVAGSYEFGLVEAVPYRSSHSGDGYSDRRGTTSSAGAGCPDEGWTMPCDWQWTYQSIQYEDFGTTPTRAKKLAWGSAPYVGTTITNDDGGEPFAGYPLVSYRVWLTFDASAGAKTRALAASIH